MATMRSNTICLDKSTVIPKNLVLIARAVRLSQTMEVGILQDLPEFNINRRSSSVKGILDYCKASTIFIVDRILSNWKV